MRLHLKVYVTDDDNKAIAFRHATFDIDLNHPEGNFERKQMKGA